MTPFECYQIYIALKQHFSSDYDCFKYNFKVKANAVSFESRGDRFFFEKLSRHNSPKDFILANIIGGSRTYIRDLAYGDEARKVYNDWLKKKESLSYVFSGELGFLDRDFNRNFLCNNSNHPVLLKLYLGNKISLETLCILCDLTGCLKHWDQQLKGDIVYKDIGLLVRKYTPFLQFDRNKFKSIIRNKVKEQTNETSNSSI